MEKPGWGPRLVEVVAGEVKRYRKAADLSTQQLSDRCAELGWPIKRSVLSNLELGYRETVTVPELLVLAAALNVAPALLVFPVGRATDSEYLPDKRASTWAAAQWFGGFGDFPTREGPPKQYREASELRWPIILFRDHDNQVRHWFTAVALVPGGEVNRRTGAVMPADAIASAEDEIKATRAEMRRFGLTPPELPAELAALLVLAGADPVDAVVAAFHGASTSRCASSASAARSWPPTAGTEPGAS